MLRERKPSSRHLTSVIQDSNPDFRINPYSDPAVYRPDRFQNVVNSLSCRRQSFCRVLWKLADDWMRNANKSPKITYSAMVSEMEKWSGIRVRDRDRITTNSWSVLPTGRLNYNIKLQWNRLITFAVILHRNRMTDRQNKWKNDKPTS